MRNLALPLLLSTAASLWSATPQPPASSPPSPTSLKPGVADEKEIPEEAKAAVTALKQFLAATTLEERLRHTLDADAMKPLMERYYQQAPAGPVIVDRIEFVRQDSGSELFPGRHSMFSLESKAWEFSVPVMLTEQPDGFKVEWPAFVEFKDRLLEKFFQTYQKEPVRFHVGIKRCHYFEDGVPDIARKDCFRLSPAPPNSFLGYAFLEKDTDLAKELRASSTLLSFQRCLPSLFSCFGVGLG